jgi:hypothetical protein
MTYPTTEDNAEHLLHFLDAVAVTAETLTSGTAIQNPTSDWGFLCVEIAAGSAGTFKAEISADGVTYKTVFNNTAADSAAAQAITVPVPPAWYVKITTSVSAISQASFVTI